MANIVDTLSNAFTPHREAFEQGVSKYLDWILQELRAIRTAQRPSLYDKWSSRPFTATNAAGAEIYRTHLNTAIKIQTLWFQAKHEKEKEPLPAFLLQINSIPVFAMAPLRILEPEEWGVYSTVFGGDLIVPRGSILEVVPMFSFKGEIRGTLTFTRELLETTRVPAGGTSQEEYNRLGHSAEYEAGRYVPDLPGSQWQGVEVPEQVIAGQQQAFGGQELEHQISDNGNTAPET